MRLALFDLDHTLLDGDTDVLWCDFLIATGVLDGAVFRARNAEMERRYQEGSVTPAEFCGFFVGTLAGRSRDEWQPIRARFMQEVILPRLFPAGRACVEAHRAAGDTLVLTTATNRYLTEPTAEALRIPHLIATEVATLNGQFTGATAGVLNMREGKVERLQAWLMAQGAQVSEALRHAVFYSDSSNDLPLLRAVGEPVVVNGDARFDAVAAAAGWRRMRFPPALRASEDSKT